MNGASPRERRLADLLTLRKDSAVSELPWKPPTSHPTPSYEVAASASAVAVVRLRSTGDADPLKMRTLWLDAFVQELTEYHAIAGIAGRLRALADSDRGPDSWSEAQARFRVWRTSRAWGALTDHPVELDSESPSE